MKTTRAMPDPESAEETGPERTCIATRAVRSPEEMIRFVLGPDGSVVPDIRHKLPGRGVWVTGTAIAVREAIRRKAFARGLRRPTGDISVPSGLVETVDGLLRSDALQSLAMANKAGRVVVGSAKVEAAVLAGRVRVLIHASDGGADGLRKLEQAHFRVAGASGPKMEKIKLFSSEELDLALGRTNVIHAALAEGGACKAFLARSLRLDVYRTGISIGAGEDSATGTLGDPSEAGEQAGVAVNGHSPGI